LVCSLITAGFVVASLWWENVGTVAVLVSTLTALIWYVLAMGCLFRLRRREPALFDHYRTPLYRVLPVTVVVLSLFLFFLFYDHNNNGGVLPLLCCFLGGRLAFFLLLGPYAASARRAGR